MESSLERIYPATEKPEETIAGSQTLQLHLQRYEYAAKMLVPGLVADIACGSGYGSHLLATISHSKILAVDNSETAITYARQHYLHPDINFILSEAMQFRSPQKLNSIISLETIEHLSDPRSFIEHLTAQLTDGGRFIASAPVTPTMDANPYHLQDFSLRSFRSVFAGLGLKEIDSMIQVQAFNPFSLFKRKKAREQEIRKGLVSYYFRHPNKFWLRAQSTLRHGFKNKYVVLVFEKSIH
jgi:2-polyprenyl-3-methyl-5-hydroxy-6-metoxy-1,4-benzoquinol methylase